MGKGKNLNPADSFRKALRKKELKKNRTERSKARDFALVKKDTWDLQDEIEKLETADSSSAKARLAELKAELEKINKKKAAYVEEHPEQRRLVYRPRRKEGDNVSDKNDLPRNPVLKDAEMDDDDDDDIPMPVGPPPGAEEEGDSDDDIPMPEGPPPGQQYPSSTSALPYDPSSLPSIPPPSPELLRPGLPPPPPPGFPPNLNHFPPPTTFSVSNSPPFPQNLPPPPPPPPSLMMGGLPFGLPQALPPGFPTFSPPPPGFLSHPLPPPPPGFFPRRTQSASAMQDPLSSIPHQTFQAHRSVQLAAPLHPSLPPNPTHNMANTASLLNKPSTAGPNVELAAATVSAAPQLRDFKKEATAFVPASIKRKKAGIGSASSSKMNPAPSLVSMSDSGADGEDLAPMELARPDLLNALKGQFGPAPSASSSTGKGKAEVKKANDYEKFVEEMGDILGPK